MEEVELANWLKQAMVWGNGHCARSPWRIVWELWFGFQAPWALMISCLLSGWGVLYIHSRANLNLGGRWWISTRWTLTLLAHNCSNYLTKCVYVLIDRFQVLFVAVLMIEQVNFMSPPPIPPSSSWLLPLQSSPFQPHRPRRSKCLNLSFYPLFQDIFLVYWVSNSSCTESVLLTIRLPVQVRQLLLVHEVD